MGSRQIKGTRIKRNHFVIPSAYRKDAFVLASLFHRVYKHLWNYYRHAFPRHEKCMRGTRRSDLGEWTLNQHAEPRYKVVDIKYSLNLRAATANFWQVRPLQWWPEQQGAATAVFYSAKSPWPWGPYQPLWPCTSSTLKRSWSAHKFSEKWLVHTPFLKRRGRGVESSLLALIFL